MNFLIRGREYLSKFEGFKLEGRNSDLQRLISILLRRNSNSVIIVGAGGSGCSAMCLGVQEAKMQPDVSFDLANKRLFWLDTNSLFSSGNGETINGGFRRILRKLHDTIEPVLVLDDTKDFIEACRNNGTMHFINAFLGLIRERKCQIILEVKEDDLDTVLQSHTDIRELFTILPIEEPDDESLVKIVTEAANILSKYHRINITDTAITTAIKLTKAFRSRYNALNRAQPELSITLIDRALSAYKLVAHKNPTGFSAEEWEKLKSQLNALHNECRDGENAISELEDRNNEINTRYNDPNSSLSEMQSPEVTDNLVKMDKIKRIIQDNRVKYSSLIDLINSKLLLTEDLVIAEFSNITGISVNKLKQDEIEKLAGLETILGKFVYGQDLVLGKVSNGIKLGKIGHRNSDKPLASYLYLGPSGVGKTTLAKGISFALLDDERALTRFDMSEYMEKHSVARMIGAPPGYEGFANGGILTNLMRKNPHRVLLFDEIEKAHPDIFNIFLQILDDGRLTDGLGRTVSFSDAIIIMTTNIGQVHFLYDADEAEAEKAAMTELEETYKPEFLNRFAGRQNIICFKKLGLDSIERIAKREINNINIAYSDRDILVTISDEDIGKLCQDRYDPANGARGLPGYISTNLETAIVNYVLSNKNQKVNLLTRYNTDLHNFEMDYVYG